MGGLEILEETTRIIRQKAPGALIIADAKRGDIGNTAAAYARAFFEKSDFDAITVNPYMGHGNTGNRSINMRRKPPLFCA